MQVYQVDDRKAWSAVALTVSAVALSVFLISISPWYLLPLAWAFAGTAWTGVSASATACSFQPNVIDELLRFPKQMDLSP